MAEAGRNPRSLTQAEALVSDAIGRLIEFWGFKRNMGRIWAVLYLAPEPLSAEDLREALCLSSGSVSMTLTELARWGVVRKVWIQGDRKDYYAPEVNLWRMISRVFHEREGREIAAAIDALAEALALVQTERVQSERASATPPSRATLQAERITTLLELARLGRRLLDTLLLTAKVDAEPLVRFLLATRAAGGPPS